MTLAARRESASARGATTASLISTSCAICSRPKPTVCTGMRRLRSAEIVSRSIPPELSAPSLSSTTAPIGKIGRFGGELLQAVADARGGSGRRRFQIVQLRNARDLPVEPVEARLKFLLQLVEHAAFERLDGLRFARRAMCPRWTCCANRPPAPR